MGTRILRSEVTMPEKQRIDLLKEQVSFLEARLTRYEELLHGPILKRIIFGEAAEPNSASLKL